MKRWQCAVAGVIALALVSAMSSSGHAAAQSGEGDAAVLAQMSKINSRLARTGLKIAVEQIEAFTIGGGRPSNRLHQAPFRWVANDPRRLADGQRLTYLVDQSDAATASGLGSAQTEAAIDQALDTWQSQHCLRKIEIVKRPDTGDDPDIYDSFFGFGGFGNPFLADITEAGWLPRAFFEAVFGPGGGRGVLAFTVTFIFVDDNGNPTDINGDRYLDTALSEIYYNDTFGTPGSDRAGNPWGINVPLPGHRRRDRRPPRKRPWSWHRPFRATADRRAEPSLWRHPTSAIWDRQRRYVRRVGILAKVGDCVTQQSWRRGLQPRHRDHVSAITS